MGDCQIYVYKIAASGAPLRQLKTEVSYFAPGSPFQAHINKDNTMDLEYVERMFSHAKFGSYGGLSKDDTILLVSSGVVNSIGEATIAEAISKSYQERWAPDQLAQSVVASSLTSACSPDDATCVVGYVCEDHPTSG